jgi:hypothetical protein
MGLCRLCAVRNRGPGGQLWGQWTEVSVIEALYGSPLFVDGPFL